MKKEIKVYWLIPAILISSLFGYFTSSFTFFTFKHEFDIISLISLIVTSSIGLYIAINLQKSLTVNKFEKDLIYNLLQSINIKSKSILKHIETNKLQLSLTVIVFKKISSTLTDLEEYAELCEVIDNENVKELRTEYLELKSLITGSKTQNGTLILSNEHKKLAEKKLNSFNKKVIGFILETNRK